MARRLTHLLAAGVFAAGAWTGASLAGPALAGPAPLGPGWTGPAAARPAPDAARRLAGLGRILVEDHVTVPGETLRNLAERHGTASRFLRATNRLKTPFLFPGQKLLLHNGEGMLRLAPAGKPLRESMEDLSRRYGRPVPDIVSANRLPGWAALSGEPLSDGLALFIPGVDALEVDTVFPVAWAPGKRFLSSGFGMRRHPVARRRKFHKGWDLPRPYGFPVQAAKDGVVVFASWRGGFGRLVILRHDDGLRTWYGHLSAIQVAAGERINKGRLIGRVGSSGLATGPHLHFEVRDRYGKALNPRKYLL